MKKIYAKAQEKKMQENRKKTKMRLLEQMSFDSSLSFYFTQIKRELEAKFTEPPLLKRLQSSLFHTERILLLKMSTNFVKTMVRTQNSLKM